MPARASSILLAIPLICSPAVIPLCSAKTHGPERLIMLKGNQVLVVLGPGREPHEMQNLAQFGAPAEYVNRDLEKLTLNEGPCIYVAGPATLAPPSAYGVVIECFDLVTEKETKAFAYATDSEGKLVTDGKLSRIGEYGKDDPHFDLAAWQWVSGRISPALERKISADRAQNSPEISANLYKVNAAGDHGEPKVTAPVLTHSVNAEFSDTGRSRHISGVSVVSVVIDANGLPQNIRSVVPLGYGMDEEAIKAVQQYRFQPSKLDGRPVPVQITIEVNFHQF